MDEINFDENTLMIHNATTYEEGIMYLKTMYRSNKDRFEKRFMEPLDTYLSMRDIENRIDILEFYSDLWDRASEFSYTEAFEIEDSEFRIDVFSIIDVPQMMENLGTTRVKTSGQRLKDRHWNTITQEFEDIEFDQVYELHKVDTTKLMDDADDDNDEAVYSIKCWCTSTDEVHWLWVDSEVAGSEDPLEAIASTCMIYESMSGRIKHIIRQGDVFLFEMLDDNYMPSEDEVKVPMKAKEYFRLLKSQS